jgi:hypothetical protein
MISNESMRIIALHRVPFEPAKFERDVQLPAYTGDELAAWREQLRGNWENAWLIVVEYVGPASDIDWGAFRHGPGKRENQQAPWLEQIIEDGPKKSLAAFFLHYVDRNLPLWYGEIAFALPEETAGAPELFRRMDYCSPD